MPEGPINIDPVPVEVTTAIDIEASVETQQTGLTDIPPDTVNTFPTPKPQLNAGGMRTLKALRGQ